MSPLNMPLWSVDYFEPKLLDKQQIQGEAFSEPPLSAFRQILQKELSGHKSPPGTLTTGEETSSLHFVSQMSHLLF